MTPTGDLIRVEAPSLVCAACKNARGYVRPGQTVWLCPPCLQRGLEWAALRAARPWWRRLLRL